MIKKLEYNRQILITVKRIFLKIRQKKESKGTKRISKSVHPDPDLIKEDFMNTEKPKLCSFPKILAGLAYLPDELSTGR